MKDDPDPDTLVWACCNSFGLTAHKLALVVVVSKPRHGIGVRLWLPDHECFDTRITWVWAAPRAKWEGIPEPARTHISLLALEKKEKISISS